MSPIEKYGTEGQVTVFMPTSLPSGLHITALVRVPYHMPPRRGNIMF